MFFLFWVRGPNFFFLWPGAWAPLAPLVGSSSTCPQQLILSECLDPTYSWLRFLLARFLFSSLFFSRSCWLFSHEQCTVHETYKLYFSATFSLKMGPMVLFTVISQTLKMLNCNSIKALYHKISTTRAIQLGYVWYGVIASIIE